MKIEKAEVIRLKIPFSDHGAGESLFPDAWKAFDFVLLRLETNKGLVGWGDAFAYSCAHAVAALTRDTFVPLVTGREVNDISDLLADLRLKTHIIGRYGITQFALSAVDMALHDLAAKAEGVSLAEHLGGQRRADVPAYASLVRYGQPGQVRDLVGRAVDEGYGLVKLHEIKPDPIRAGREGAGPDVLLTNDVNCNWSAEYTRELAPLLREIDLYWLEEPIFPPEDWETLASLRADTGLRLAAGENACTEFQFAEMIRAGAVDFIQPSVTKVGGIAETMATRARAQAAGQKVAQHAPYFGPGYLATLQILCAVPDEEWFEYLYVEREVELFPDMPLPERGRVSLPDGPGLGLDPDPAVLERYAV